MSSFNAFTQKNTKVGGNVAIWCGVVSPLPVGGTLASAYAKAGAYIPAGSAIHYDAVEKAIYPFLTWEIVSKDTSAHTLTVKPNAYGILPEVDSYMGVVGAKFDTTGAAEKVNAVALGEGGNIVVTFNSTNIESAATAGKFIALSSATAAGGSGKSLAHQPNAYLYNDIRIDGNAEYTEVAASGAVVKFHAEGILIDRTPCAPFAEQMAVAVPNVCQIKG